MKIIIGENRMFEIMDSILKLSYNPETREFYSLEKLWSAEGSYSSEANSV